MAAAEITQQPTTLDDLMHYYRQERAEERRQREADGEQARQERIERTRAEFDAHIKRLMSKAMREIMDLHLEYVEESAETRNDYGSDPLPWDAVFTHADEEYIITKRWVVGHTWEWKLAGPEGFTFMLGEYLQGHQFPFDRYVLDGLAQAETWIADTRHTREELAQLKAEAAREKAEQPAPSGPTNYRLISRAMTHAHERGAEVVLQLVDGTQTWREATVDGYDEHAVLITHAGAQRLVPWCHIAEIVLHPGLRVDEEVPF